MADCFRGAPLAIRRGSTSADRDSRIRREHPTLALGLILALLQADGPSGFTRPTVPGEVAIVASDALLPLAESLADEARRPRAWLGLDTVDVTPMTLVLVENAEEFARWSQGRVPPWGAGLAVPGRRLIVIRRDAADPFKTLRHELAHLALHTRVRGRVPLWFSEGYAALAAGEHGRLDALQLNLAVALNRVPTLDGVDAALRGTSADAGTAYALAADAVADVARRHPTRSLAPLLGRLGDGEPFGPALLASTGLDLDRFGERWQRAVRGRYNLGIWTLTGGAWLFLAGVLAFLAALRRRRDAPRRAALDTGWVIEDDAEDEFRQNDGTMTTGLGDPHTLDRPLSGR